MPKTRRRRRGVYISPFLLLAAGLILAALAGYLIWNGLNPGGGSGSDSAGTGQPVNPSGSTQRREEHAVTASGVACTLTDLGEDAVYTGDLVLVSNAVPFHFPAQQDLVSIYENKTSSYYVRDMEVLLCPVALNALNDMLDDFIAQGGSKTVNVVAGHRTKEFQEHLFEQSAGQNGLDHAKEFVAQPGGSEHHTGLVVDLHLYFSNGTSDDYTGTGEYAWINSHCQEYGYVVRYAGDKQSITGIADEPWHFRYVGVPHATEMVERKMCLEEYIDYLRQFPFDGEHLTIEAGGKQYEVWYDAGSEAYLPDSGHYTVSGNNVDGVIVTCEVS